VNQFSTAHLGFASFLFYCLGDDSFVKTIREVNGTKFTHHFVFNDAEGVCPNLNSEFFSPDGAQVGDARALLECNRTIKRTIRSCDLSPNGTWYADGAEVKEALSGNFS
jgi:hypothetical protein